MFPKKIPSLLGILLIGGLVYLVSKGSSQLYRTESKASQSVNPKSVLVTNITDTSFTVNWHTDDPATGTVVVSGDSIKSASNFDERDKLGKQSPYVTHLVTIGDLKPSTLYTFNILSDGKSYQGAQPFTVTTANNLPTTTSTVGPIYGTVRTPSDEPSTYAIVSVSFDNSQTLSALSTDTGSWLVPLNQIRTSSLDNYLEVMKSAPLHIRIQYQRHETLITTTLSNDSPVPTVLLGKQYDFRLQSKSKNTQFPQNLAQLVPTTSTKSVLGEISEKFPVLNTSLNITQPKDKAVLVSAQPLFQGTGNPGKTLTLILTTIIPKTYTLTIADDGMWRFTPPKPLGSGDQTVTVESIDTDGKSTSLTHEFEILKSGTQVLGDATPSGTIVPTAIPTETQELASPTAELESPTPATTSPDLQPGNELPLLLLVGFATILIMSGLVVIF